MKITSADPRRLPPEVPPPWQPARPDQPYPPAPLLPRLPGALDDELFTRLLERRIVLVAGFLDGHAATRAAAQLMLLDATGDEPIDVHLSCPDGDLDAAGSLADTIDLVGVTVRAWCSGKLGGPALAPLAAADRRIAQPHCMFVLKEPSMQLHGRADEIASLAATQQRQLDSFQVRLADATGQPLERVVADTRQGLTLDADQAVAYGLVHEVAAPRRAAG